MFADFRVGQTPPSKIDCSFTFKPLGSHVPESANAATSVLTAWPNAPPCRIRGSHHVRRLSPPGRHEVDQRPTALHVVRATPEAIDPDGVTQLENALTVDALDRRFKVGEKWIGENIFR